jgi:DNA-binding transcriptional MerR regulator
VEDVHITEAAQRLGVSAQHLRQLERQGRIRAARRDEFGARIFSDFDIAVLKAQGIGDRRRLRRPEEVLETAK